MHRVLIIGIGNTLRRDDGVGIVAAQKLEKSLADQVRVIACQQLTPELAKDISEVDRVIIIDAEQGNMHGRITVKEIEPGDHAQNSFSHELDPATLLTCSRELYGKYPNAFLITVTGGTFDFGEGLSLSAAGAMQEVLRHVRDLALYE
jgi:hydrogenase maturation protease